MGAKAMQYPASGQARTHRGPPWFFAPHIPVL